MDDYRDFYTTLAQVLPVLLLTIVWDRDYLSRVATRTRRTASTPDGVRIWTKPVVRWYSIVLSSVLILAVAVCLLVLGGAFADVAWLRGVLVGVLLMALATLVVRISAGVLDATR